MGPIRIEENDLEPVIPEARVASDGNSSGGRNGAQADAVYSGTMKANRRIAGKLCSICQSQIKLGETIQNCEYCRLPFHLSCWQENHGCGTYGCAGAPAAPAVKPSDVDFSVQAAEVASRKEAQQVSPSPAVEKAPESLEGGLAAKGVSGADACRALAVILMIVFACVKSCENKPKAAKPPPSPAASYSVQICPTCNGVPRVVCGLCGGSGALYDGYGRLYRCGRCGGYGQFQCQTCSGTGRLLIRQ